MGACLQSIQSEPAPDTREWTSGLLPAELETFHKLVDGYKKAGMPMRKARDEALEQVEWNRDNS